MSESCLLQDQRGKDRENDRINQWIRKAMHIRKKQDNSMNQDERSYQLQHIYDYLVSVAAKPDKQSVKN